MLNNTVYRKVFLPFHDWQVGNRVTIQNENTEYGVNAFGRQHSGIKRNKLSIENNNN